MKAENIHRESRVVRVEIIDVDTLARNWWIVLLRGLAGIIFGLITFFAPEISLAALVLVFGAYAFADGVLAIVSAIRERGEARHWWMLLLEGVMGIGAAAVTLFWPGITALALLYLIAAWALVTGGFELAAAIRLRKIITGEWLLALIGDCLNRSGGHAGAVPERGGTCGRYLDWRLRIGFRRAPDDPGISAAFLGKITRPAAESAHGLSRACGHGEE